MQFRYPIDITKDPEGGYIARVTDIPEAITFGDTIKDAIEEANDAALVALTMYIEDSQSIPNPSPAKGRESVIFGALTCAKLALYQTMLDQHINNTQLAKRIGVTEAVVRRLLDLDHLSKIEKIESALDRLGVKLVVSAMAA